jgi:hypothetical protein
MPFCEKCWRDARGEPTAYHKLLAERAGDLACTPEEQAGGVDANTCELCGRKTIHMHVGCCMNPECEAAAEDTF